MSGVRCPQKILVEQHSWKPVKTAFQFWDADTPSNTGYIHNGASIHLIASNLAVTGVTREGYAEMSQQNPINHQKYLSSLPFVYNAKEIVEEA